MTSRTHYEKGGKEKEWTEISKPTEIVKSEKTYNLCSRINSHSLFLQLLITEIWSTILKQIDTNSFRNWVQTR